MDFKLTPFRCFINIAYFRWLCELIILDCYKQWCSRIEKEKHDLERIHNLTEEERRQEQKSNPKVVTNKMSKGKYKFLQKYYHRGAFFLVSFVYLYEANLSISSVSDERFMK